MPEPYLVTKYGISRLETRLKELQQRLSSMGEELSQNYETGGYWHDNGGWDEARRAQFDILSEIRELKGILTDHRLIDDMDIDGSRAGVGTIVTIKWIETDEIEHFTILGTYEFDPDNNIISHQAPLAQAIKGKIAGNTINFRGNEICIINIVKWRPKAG
jgi:transcription elongation factor GreA